MKWYCEYPDLEQCVKAHPDDAGYDIRSAVDISVDRDQCPIMTGLHVSIPPGYVGILKPRSGLAMKYGADVLAGVIDSGYLGEVVVILTTKMPFTVHRKDKIAQLIIQELPKIEMEKAATLEELGVTERGDNGFGSTGIQ